MQAELQGDAAPYRPLVQEARRRAYAEGDTLLAELLNAWLLRYGGGAAQGQ